MRKNKNEEEYRQNISNLIKYLDTGELNRKTHWKTYNRALRVARKNPQEDKELKVLSEVDSFFYEKWRVPKVRSSIGIPLLILSVLIVQFSYFIIISQNLLFILGLILFFIFSLTNFTLSHVIYHWIFGIALGIRFKSIFFYKSSFRKARFPFNLIGNFMPAFGIKYDVYTFLNAQKWKRTVMFVSAPLLTWVWFFINYFCLLVLYSSEISFLLLIGILLVITFLINQVLSYYGKGDLWKANLDYK